MRLRPSIILVLVAATGLLAVMVQARRLNLANGQLTSAAGQLEVVGREAQEMVDLAARRPQASVNARPTDDLLALVNDTLRHAGMPAERLQGLAPESDRPLASGLTPNGASTGGATYRVQVVRVSLTELTLQELGIFLHHWRQAEALWTPVEFHLDASARGSGPEDPGRRFDVTIRLSVRYVADNSGVPA